METNNWRHTPPCGEPSMDSGDWRNTLQPDSRQRIVNKIMDTLKRHLPFSGKEGLNELRKIAVRFEEKNFTAASSQADYLRRISLKMLAMETKSQNTMPNTGNNSKPPDPGSQGMLNQVHSQGQSIPIPLQSNQSQARQQLLPQSSLNDIDPSGVQSSAGLQSGMPPVSGPSQNPISNVVGQNSNIQNMSGILQNSMGQGMPSNIFANQQRQMQGRQQVLPQQQQQQQLYHQQLQKALIKQKIQQGNLQPSLLQSHMRQLQQQNLLPPTQLQSSQQSGMQTSSIMQPSAMQSTPLPGLQQNQQSSLQQSTQSMLQQHQQSVLRQHYYTSLDSTAQTGHSNGGDWQEEVYQKIKAIKETYFSELTEMHKKISAKLLQVEHDSLPQQPKSERHEKMKIFKTMLERFLSFLTISKAAIVPAYKDKLSSYEEQIRKFIIANRPRKPVTALQQGQLPPPHMHSMQQTQPQSNQTNPQFPSMMPFVPSLGTAQIQQWKKQMQRLQQLQLLQMLQPRGLHQVDEQQSPANIKTNELSYWHQIDIDSGVLQENLPSNQLPGYEQARSEYHAPDTGGIGVPPTMSIPPLLPGFKEVNDTSDNALTTDFGKPDIAEQPHNLKVTVAKPNSLSATVVTMVDEAVTAVGKDLAAMRKQGLHERNFFTQTGMSGAEKMRCCLSALVILALLIFFIFNLNHQY